MDQHEVTWPHSQAWKRIRLEYLLDQGWLFSLWKLKYKSVVRSIVTRSTFEMNSVL